MKIAIIGGGFTGLAAAYHLGKFGHTVTIFEKEANVGGLAVGLKKNHWFWPLETSYHHFFTNDWSLIHLAKKIGLKKDLMVYQPTTATLIKNNKKKFYDIYQLDSPIHLFTFPLLSFIDKVRTAALLAFCKLNPFWQPLEKITAEKFFRETGGTNAWNILWQPLMEGKFGNFFHKIPASWLWARFHKRTSSLGYFRGGFQAFADKLAAAVKKQGGTVILNSDIVSIKKEARGTRCKIRMNSNKKTSSLIPRTSYFDAVLITTPSSIATKLFTFPKTYKQGLTNISHLYAQTLILETQKPILEKTYWLNINDRSFPFLALVQHTNMIDKKQYGGNHIAYIGNYLPKGHPYLSMTKQQLLKIFLPYIKKLHLPHNAKLVIRNSYIYTIPFAQPVHTINYSKKAPTIKTPIAGVYLANLDSIYPWDRGTNYAVELGQKAAKIIHNSLTP